MKNTSLVSKIFLLITLTAGLTYAGEPQWISDSKGCKVANVFPQEDESINWTGACEQGLATGEGKLTWLINGIVTDTYEGQLVKGWALVPALRTRNATISQFSDNVPAVALSHFTQFLKLVLNRLA